MESSTIQLTAMYLLGSVFHLFTSIIFFCVYYTVQEYMASQGLDMADPEEMPYDPYTFNRRLQEIPKITKTPPADDKFRRFLEYDGKVLRYIFRFTMVNHRVL